MRLLAIVVALLLGAATRADALLKNFTFQPHFDLFTRMSHNMMYGNASLDVTCTMEPRYFDVSVGFYVITCPMSVRMAILQLDGTSLYNESSNDVEVESRTFSLALLEFGKPVIAPIYSCPEGRVPSSDRCTVYTFDVYRLGGDFATLTSLSITSSSDRSTVQPAFSKDTLQYHTTVYVNTPFSLSASAAEPGSKVGVEEVFSGDARSKDSSLGAYNGCNLGSHRHNVWDVKGIPSEGEHEYRICAIAADGTHYTNYTLKVTVVPNYSSRLHSLLPKLAGAKLVPDFDPSLQTYELIIDPKTMVVPFDVHAEDKDARLSFSFGGFKQPTKDNCDTEAISSCRLFDCRASRNAVCENHQCVCRPGHCAVAGRCVPILFNETPVGSTQINLAMHNNSHLGINEAPQWSKTMTVSVESQDKYRTTSYMVTVKQNVSKFSDLGGIETKVCKLDPPFQVNITEYSCVWWWENETDHQEHEWATFTPIMSTKGCEDCELRIPKPNKYTAHLSLSFRRVFADVWATYKSPKTRWNRTFLYGEWHYVPVTVLSADKYHHTTYTIMMYRDCPWWMATRFTRAVSHYSSMLATFLAFSSSGNFMALAKQLQFLGLVTDIEGIPKIFNDFAETIKGWNFDVAKYLPDFGLPTFADLKNMSRTVMSQIEQESGLAGGKLMLHVCYTQQLKGRLQANKILKFHDGQTENNVKAMYDKINALHAKGYGQLSARDATSRRLSPDVDGLRLRGAGGAASSDTESQYAAEYSAGPLSDVVARRRRLDLDDIMDDDDEEEEEVDADGYQAIWTWTDSDWDDFNKEDIVQGVTEDTYPPIDCTASPMVTRGIKGLIMLHKWSIVKAMLHSTSGSLLVSMLTLAGAGILYGLFYHFFMRGRQRRYSALEPRELWLFLADFWVISFAKNASKMVFDTSAPVELFYYHPDRHLVVLVCLTSLVLYPFCFTCCVLIGVYYITNRRWMVWDETSCLWTDPACNDLRVIIPSKAPPIPPLPSLFERHIRHCIPVLDEEGEAMTFGETKVFLLKHTIVRVKRTFSPLEGDDETQLLRGTVGVVLSSTEESADVSFGKTVYELKSDTLRNLEPRYIKKGKIMVLVDDMGSLKKRTRGKLVDIVYPSSKTDNETSRVDELTFKIQFGEHAAETVVTGDKLKLVAPEVRKKMKANSKKALKKELLLQQEQFLANEDDGQNLDHRNADTILGLGAREKAQRKQEEKARKQLEAEKDRRDKHQRVLGSLVYHSQAMSYSLGGPMQKHANGAAQYEVTLPQGEVAGLEVVVDKVEVSDAMFGRVLKIVAEPSTGSAEQYNKLQDKIAEEQKGKPEQQRTPIVKIKKGDLIVCVNQIWGDGIKMQNMLLSKQVLTLKIIRPDVKKTKAAACPPWLYCEIEQVRNELKDHVEKTRADDTYLAKQDKGWNKIIPVGDLIATYESMKHREDTDRLQPEESFAILAYIRDAIRLETKLRRFNILTVEYRDGYLKPKEPMIPEFQQVSDPSAPWEPDRNGERWWLTLEEYDKTSPEGGHPWLAQFGPKTPFIENSRGERLIYQGNDNPGLHWLFAPAGRNSGKCIWESEPDQGWNNWEESHYNIEVVGEGPDAKRVRKGPKKWSGKRYADKWQWFLLECWKREWEFDEIDEESIKIGPFITIPSSSVPMYSAIKKFFIRRYREHIPNSLPREEKLDVRKWLWAELAKTMDIKLKLAWCAAQHPKYYKGESLEDMCHKDFKKTLQDIEHAKEALVLEHEVEGKDPHELLNYALMKFEDLHDGEDEPWWAACDPTIEGEKRVMFDHKVFFSRDDGFRRHQETGLVPAGGYFTSRGYQQHPDEKVGKKRYMLLKPDASETPFTVDVCLTHIHTLMRYTDFFKLNVPEQVLELPQKFQWNLVLGDKGRSEWYMYGVDRLLVLGSIIALAASQTGVVTCSVFLLMKIATFIFAWMSKYESFDDEEEDTVSPEADYIRLSSPESEDGGFVDMSEGAFKKWFRRKEGDSAAVSSFSKAMLCLFDWRVMAALLQVITLAFLLVGLLGGLPGPIVALWCIAISCLNMLYMNAATMGRSLRKLWQKVNDIWRQVSRAFILARVRMRDILAGDNIFGYAFITDVRDGGNGSSSATATRTNVLVQRLGLAFPGLPDEDDTLPYDEVMMRRMTKQIAYHILRTKDIGDRRPKSVRELQRFDTDISPSMGIALSVEQLMHRKVIPQIMCTIQCVNHVGTKMSKLHHDSFLTLFKPENWEAEDDYNAEKVAAMVNDWQGKVKDWLVSHAGAVYTERTCAEKITDEIKTLLNEECTQSDQRKVRKVRVGSVRLPARHQPKGARGIMSHYDGCYACAMVLWDSENVCADYPGSRTSGYGKIVKVERTEIDFPATLRKKPVGCGFTVKKSGGDIVVDQIFPHGHAQEWNDTCTDPERRITPGDIVKSLKVNLQPTLPSLVNEYKKPARFSLVFKTPAKPMQDNREYGVDLNASVDGWGAEFKPSSLSGFPVVHSVVEGSSFANFNRSRESTSPGEKHEPIILPNDEIVEVAGVKDSGSAVRRKMESELATGADGDVTFKIKRRGGTSEQTHFALKGAPLYTLRVTLQEAKQTALLDERVMGFAILPFPPDEALKVKCRADPQHDCVNVTEAVTGFEQEPVPCERCQKNLALFPTQYWRCTVSGCKGCNVCSQCALAEQAPVKAGEKLDVSKTYWMAFHEEWMAEYQENCRAFRVERDPHIEYHCEINTEFDCVLPTNVNRLRIAVWSQTKTPRDQPSLFGQCMNFIRRTQASTGETAWEELVAYSKEVDIIDSTFAQREKLGAKHVLHAKFEQTAQYTLEPWGRELEKDDEQDDDVDLERLSCWTRVKRKVTGAASQCFSSILSQVRAPVTKEEVEKTKGEITFGILDDPETNFKSEDEHKRAMKSMREALTGGGMNIEKLLRHRDRWIELSKAFGLNGWSRLGVSEIKSIKDHIANLEDVTAAVKEDDIKSLEGVLLKKGIRRQLASPEVSGDLVMSCNIAEELVKRPELADFVKSAIVKLVEACKLQGVPVVKVFLSVQKNVKDEGAGRDDAGDDGIRVKYTASVGTAPAELAAQLNKPKALFERVQQALHHFVDKNELEQSLSLGFVSHTVRTALKNTIAHMTEDVARIQERADRIKALGITAIPPHRLKYRRVGYHIHDLKPHESFEKALLDMLFEEDGKKRAGAKQILHYVCMSDHLKPTKNWKPDPIMPHPCEVTTQEFEDVESVTLTGGADPEKRLFTSIVFNRELRADGANQPAVLNGRLLFKAVETDGEDSLGGFPRWSVHEQEVELTPQTIFGKQDEVMTMREAKAQAAKKLECKGFTFLRPADAGEGGAVSDDARVTVTFVKKWTLLPSRGKQVGKLSVKKNDLWMYWDGHSRWVVSPRKGEPPSYGWSAHNSSFLWAQDTKALTPDMVANPWKRWTPNATTVGAEPKGSKGGSGKWDDDTEIKATSKHASSKAKGRAILQRAEQDRDREDGGYGEDETSLVGIAVSYARDVFAELFAIFSSERHIQVDPSTRNALVGMDSKKVSFTWKDDGIEKLAPFRKMLLTEFGSYEVAWTFMTSAMQMPRSLARRNLALMLFRTSLEIRTQEQARSKKANIAGECRVILAHIDELDKGLKQQAPEILVAAVTNFTSFMQGIKDKEVVDAFNAVGWTSSGWTKRASDTLYSTSDPESQEQMLKEMRKVTRRLRDKQGTVCDMVRFPAEFPLATTVGFEDNVLPEWTNVAQGNLGVAEADHSLPVYFVQLTVQIKFAADTKSVAKTKVPESTITCALASAFNVDQAAIVVRESTTKAFVARVTWSDKEGADECATQAPTMVAAIGKGLSENGCPQTQVGKLDAQLVGVSYISFLAEEAQVGEKSLKERVEELIKNKEGLAVGGKNIHASCALESVKVIKECKHLTKKGGEGSQTPMGKKASDMGRGTSMTSMASGQNQALGRESLLIMEDFLNTANQRYGQPDPDATKRDQKKLKELEQRKKQPSYQPPKNDEDEDRDRLEESMYESLAAIIVDRLDADRSGTLDVSELYALYTQDTALQQNVVQFEVCYEPYELVRCLETNAKLHDSLARFAENAIRSNFGKKAEAWSVGATLDDDSEAHVLASKCAIVVPMGESPTELQRSIETNAKTIAQAIVQNIGKDKDWQETFNDLQNKSESSERMRFNARLLNDVRLKKADSLLEDFRTFLRAHPSYRKLENMWAEFSEDVEIGIEDFTRALKSRMHKVVDPELTGVPDEDRAQVIFSHLDAQLSGGVTLKELIPSSGREIEDVDQSLMTLTVPLAHLQEVRLEGAKKKDPEGRQVVRLVLHPQFQQSKDWATLRTAMDPDWEPKPAESLEVLMQPRHYELWKAVVRVSEMGQPQEFIMHYAGGVQDHPMLGGTYMRDGEGLQHWVDGKIYQGSWSGHVYNGFGSLYANDGDFQANKALYRGQWLGGKRHGVGTMVWEQQLLESAGGRVANRAAFVGITKRYDGEFRNDLFHGQGTLEILKAKAQTLNLASAARMPAPGTAHAPQVDPHRLVSFTGQFESDWDETDRLVRMVDLQYHKNYEELRMKPQGSMGPTATGASAFSRATSFMRSGTTRMGTRTLSTAGGIAGGRTISSAGRLLIDRSKARIEAMRGRGSTYSRIDDISDDLGLADPDLALTTINRKDRSNKSSKGYMKLQKYFPTDARRGVQGAGATLPDLALSAYRLGSWLLPDENDEYGNQVVDSTTGENRPVGGFDTMHMRDGFAKFADGTEYDGEFFAGRLHGKCRRMTQYIHTQTGPAKLSEYVGDMKDGLKHGNGSYRVFSFDKDGNPHKAFRVGVEVSASKIAENSEGLLYQKVARLDKQSADGILQKKELGGLSLEAWCRKTGQNVATWGTIVEGVVEGDFLKVSDGKYLPLRAPSSKWMGISAGQNVAVLFRAEEQGGLLYEGQFKEGKKSGIGKLTVPTNLRDSWGFSSYKGMWYQDMRDGEGEMSYGERDEFLYIGPFKNDRRETYVVDAEDDREHRPLWESLALTRPLSPSLKDSVGIKKLGKVFMQDEAKTDKLLVLEPNIKTFQSGFAKFTTRPGRFNGAVLHEGGDMTIAAAMLQAVTLEGCVSFTVDSRNIWPHAQGPFSHMNFATDDVEYKIVFYAESMAKAMKREEFTADANVTTFRREADYIMLLHGEFKDDNVAENARAWCHLVNPGERLGRYYYGHLTAESTRSGFGTMYIAEMPDEKLRNEFVRSFEEGSIFSTDTRPHPRQWPLTPANFLKFDFSAFFAEYVDNNKYKDNKLEGIMYHGMWVDDLPHGNGVQHFDGFEKGGGTYCGQFRKGMRQGLGVWTTYDGRWKYLPLPSAQREKPLMNWDADKMHGVGIVEDDKCLHENIIFTKGVCQMPFTDNGPPTSGFQPPRNLGTFIGVNKGHVVRNAAPAETLSQSPTKRGARTPTARGLDPTETRALATGLRQGSVATLRTMGSSANGPRADTEGDQDVVAVLREPTDLNLPEEDVIISGGTGVNEALNGVYFKLTDTFGVPMYRLVKRNDGWLMSERTQRFLYRDPAQKCWILSSQARGGITIKAGCAFCEDEAENPSEVREPWCVWHGPSNTLKSPVLDEGGEAATEKTKLKTDKDKVDTIQVRSLLGFIVSNAPKDATVEDGHMLRSPQELYGRPVYESENKRQYLYWMQEGGSLENGTRGNAACSRDDDGVKAFFKKNGYWVFARQVGLQKDSDGCFAIAEDLSVTPDQIPKETKWKLNKGHGVFDPSDLQLEPQVWETAADFMAGFRSQTEISHAHSLRSSHDAPATTPLLAGATPR